MIELVTSMKFVIASSTKAPAIWLFATVQVSRRTDLTASGITLDDVTFCERCVVEFGVAAIPVSAFFAEDPVRNVARLCFAKTDETLDAALERLAAARAAFT